MPMSECVLDQQQQQPQQAPRLAASPQAVTLALPLPLVHLLALYLLLALAPCPCPGLSNSGALSSNNWTTTVGLRNLGWKYSPRPAVPWILKKGILKTSNTSTDPIPVPAAAYSTPSFQDTYHLQVEEQGRVDSTFSETAPQPSTRRVTLSRSYPEGTPEDAAHSRHPRSPRVFWPVDRGFKDKSQTHADSHILVLNEEQVRYIYREKTRRFSFSLKKRVELEVTITPCTSEVMWTFLGPGKGYLKDQRPEKKVLVNVTTTMRQTFKLTLVPAVYSIDVTSLNSDFDSRVFIYLNTETDIGGGSGRLYPPLPVDNLVKANAEGSSKTTRKIEVHWKPAASWSDGYRLEYCLTISRIRNFSSNCAALAYVEGVQVPKQAQWGEIKTYRRKGKARKALARPVVAQSPKSVFYTCVGNKTSFTYTEKNGAVRLRGGRRYYVDVFVKNLDKNTTSAYKGVSARIKRKTKMRHSLQVGDSRSFRLRPRRRPKIEILLNQTSPKLILEIMSCQGRVPVQISLNDKEIRRKTVSRYKQFVISNEPPGKFVVTFPTRTKRKRKAARTSNSLSALKGKRRRRRKKPGVMLVTLSLPPQRSPVKSLPKDLSVSELPKLSGCRNVTLQWRAAAGDYEYCVYRRVLNATSDLGRETRDVCREAGGKPRHTVKVSCKSHKTKTKYKKSKKPQHETVTYTVHDLDPGTDYRFDVLITRSGMTSVPYDGIRLRTPLQCNKSTSYTRKDFRVSRRNRKKGVIITERRRKG